MGPNESIEWRGQTGASQQRGQGCRDATSGPFLSTDSYLRSKIRYTLRSWNSSASNASGKREFFLADTLHAER